MRFRKCKKKERTRDESRATCRKQMRSDRRGRRAQPPQPANRKERPDPKRQNAQKCGRTLKFCTIRTKAMCVRAPHKPEIPDLINKIDIYADYFRLIRLAEPRRWYVSCKIRVRGSKIVHFRREYHGCSCAINMPGTAFGHQVNSGREAVQNTRTKMKTMQTPNR